MEQVTEITYRISRDDFGWEVTCGDFAANESSLDTVIRNIKSLSSAGHKLGVW